MKMKKQELFDAVFGRFEKNEPAPETELTFKTEFQLVVAVILSAQCTDKRVNMITPGLFERFPDPESMAASNPAAIYELIKSCSYPNNKAKNLHALATELLSNHNGKLPRTVEELETLPGIGRKTANVVASVAFSLPAMAVDTHVFRVSNRIGLTDAKNPKQSEEQLVKFIKKEKIHHAHHWLILHGRYVCKARKPECSKCLINDLCQFKDKTAG